MYIKTTNLIEAIKARLAAEVDQSDELEALQVTAKEANEAVRSMTTEALARGLVLERVEHWGNQEIRISVAPALDADNKKIAELVQVQIRADRAVRDLQWQLRQRALSQLQKVELKATLQRAEDFEAERSGKSFNTPKSVYEVLDTAILNKD